MFKEIPYVLLTRYPAGGCSVSIKAPLFAPIERVVYYGTREAAEEIFNAYAAAGFNMCATQKTDDHSHVNFADFFDDFARLFHNSQVMTRVMGREIESGIAPEDRQLNPFERHVLMAIDAYLLHIGVTATERLGLHATSEDSK